MKNRDKLIEAIRLSIARVLDFKVNEKELELLADHLIENGIGDITAEKHRADVAEEALKLMTQRCSTTCIYGKGEDFADIMKQVGYFKQRAEERLKERV